MDVNETGLSPSEHAEVRDRLLTGARRIRPVGKHRSQLIAGAVALVLVAAVTSGALVFANLRGSIEPQPFDTPTPTATPTPSSKPTPSRGPTPAAGVVPFGGQCENVLTDADVDALRGIGMGLADFRWETGENAVLGGIDCLWLSEESYNAASIRVYAYPETVVPASVRDAVGSGCEQGGSSKLTCSHVGAVGGTWLAVIASAPADQISAEGVDVLFEGAADRLAEHPAAAAEPRTAGWWTSPECDRLVTEIDPTAYGFEHVELQEPQQATPADDPGQVPALVGALTRCTILMTSGSGDTRREQEVRVTVVPGAARFQTAADAGEAKSVSVEGAATAVWVAGNSRYDATPDVLVVTDDVNVLILSPAIWEPAVEPAEAPRLAGALLGGLSVEDAADPPPSSPSTSGVVAFGGACENAMTDEDVTAAFGRPMTLVSARWELGAESVLGGISCLWNSTEYNAAYVALQAYPSEIVPDAIVEADGSGCQSDLNRCVKSAGGDGTWIRVETWMHDQLPTVEMTAGMYDTARTRSAEYPPPSAVSGEDEWWKLPDCDDLAASLDSQALGFSAIESVPDDSLDGPHDGEPHFIPESVGIARYCSMLLRGSGVGEVNVLLHFVAGAGLVTDVIARNSGAESVSVPGARAALVAPDRDPVDGGSDSLVVTDGVNVMTLQPNTAASPADFAEFAGAVIAQLQHRGP